MNYVPKTNWVSGETLYHTDMNRIEAGVAEAFTATKGEKGDAGIQGPQGEIGPQGLQGIKGDDGALGPIGEQGPQGIQGLQGPAGPQGIEGQVGPVGPAGLTWRGQYNSSTAYVMDDAVSYQGATYFSVSPSTGVSPLPENSSWALLAAQGARGEKGDKGDTGAQGVQGIAGQQGIRGLTGLDGAQGPQGERGIQGIQGLPGAKGDTGERGLQGIAGPQGIQGPKGDTGAQGPASTYTLPNATNLVLGGVRVGNGLSVSSGLVSVTPKEYLFTSRNSAQAFNNVGETVNFNSGTIENGISYSSSTSQFTLKQGKIYKISFNTSVNFSASNGFVLFSMFNASTGAQLAPVSAGYSSIGSNFNEAGNGIMDFIYIPVANISALIRVASIQTGVTATIRVGYTSLVIQEL